MKPLSETAAEMAKSIDQRFGVDDVVGLTTYLSRSLHDVAVAVRAETAVPEYDDPVDALTRYFARRAGHDPDNPNWYMHHRWHAGKICQAFYCEGMSITDLAGFFLGE
jgi:hypothetical protein